MPDQSQDLSLLDKALNIATEIPQMKTELRNDFLRSIFPDALLPAEIVQKEAAEMKQEGPKTLHARKYDRRMKFNTAVERSDHEMTKEEPAWMKEAVEKIAISEGLATRALMRATEGATDAASSFSALKKYPRINLRAQGVANPNIRKEALPPFQEMYDTLSQMSLNPEALTPEMSSNLLAKLQDSQNNLAAILGKKAEAVYKLAVDPDFTFNGQTGREQVVSIEDELPKTPPLPIEEPIWYSNPNKPVMEKSSAEEKEPYSVLRDKGLLAGLGVTLGSDIGLKAISPSIGKSIYPIDPVQRFSNEKMQQKLLSSLPKDLWKKVNRPEPEVLHLMPDELLQAKGRGPMYVSSLLRKLLTEGKNTKPFIYTPRVSSPEILSHELGHSLQHPVNAALSVPGRFMAQRPLALANTIMSLVAHKKGLKDPEEGKGMAYTSAVLGGATAIPMIANEINASTKGLKLLRNAKMKPAYSKLFLPNLTYLLGAASMGGIPTALGINRWLRDRKQQKVEGAATNEP